MARKHSDVNIQGEKKNMVFEFRIHSITGLWDAWENKVVELFKTWTKRFFEMYIIPVQKLLNLWPKRVRLFGVVIKHYWKLVRAQTLEANFSSLSFTHAAYLFSWPLGSYLTFSCLNLFILYEGRRKVIMAIVPASQEVMKIMWVKA